jgi:hypothetical protein
MGQLFQRSEINYDYILLFLMRNYVGPPAAELRLKKIHYKKL